MSVPSGFRYVLEEVRVFHRNLGKDPDDRRKDIRKTQRYVSKLDRVKNEFADLKLRFNSDLHEEKVLSEVREYVKNIEKYVEAIGSILGSRLSLAQTEQTESSKQSDSNSALNIDCGCSEEEKMGEKFDLKTAASLLPVMNGSELVTKQLIDAISWYDSL